MTLPFRMDWYYDLKENPDVDLERHILGGVSFDGKGKLHRELPLYCPLYPWLHANDFTVADRIGDLVRFNAEFVWYSYFIVRDIAGWNEWERYVEMFSCPDEANVTWHVLPDDEWFVRHELTSMIGCSGNLDFLGFVADNYRLADIKYNRRTLGTLPILDLTFCFDRKPSYSKVDFRELFACPVDNPRM